jgi:3-isopropylmalate dehydrogenase
MYHPSSAITAAGGIPAPTRGDGPLVFRVLEGEGVGPELTRLCRDILEVVSRSFGWTCEVRVGGAIGMISLRESGAELSDEVCDFCQAVFDDGGAILAGAGGGRFVYDMRRRFQLYVKLNPLPRFSELEPFAGDRWRGAAADDILVVRENLGGLYQGASAVIPGADGVHVEHRFHSKESDILRVAMAAARMAAARRGHLTVVAKQSGLPEMTRLWFDCARQAADAQGVSLRTLDIDYAVYQFLAAPNEFDVLVTPNCFGDILADLGGLISGSRGSTFGASYSDTGAGVYQTNHGAAYDLAGKDICNPVGQILSLAMMLRESYARPREADAIIGAVRQTWRDGWRTADLREAGCRTIGTREFAQHVLEKLVRHEEVADPA